jgi:hypothetical protein
MIQRVKESQMGLEDTHWSLDGLVSWRDIESNCALTPCLISVDYEGLFMGIKRVSAHLCLVLRLRLYGALPLFLHVLVTLCVI